MDSHHGEGYVHQYKILVERKHNECLLKWSNELFQQDDLLNGCETLLDIFEKSFYLHTQKYFSGTFDPDSNSYQFKTYNEIQLLSSKCAKGLKLLGADNIIGQHNGVSFSLIGIWSQISEKDLVIVVGCFCNNIAIVRLNKDYLSYFFDTLGLTTLVTQSKMLQDILNIKSETRTALKFLKTIILLDDCVSEEALSLYKEHDIQVILFDKLVELGSKSTVVLSRPKSDSLAGFGPTSGSTGISKIIPLTHANLVALVKGLDQNGFKMSSSDTYECWLSFATCELEFVLLHAIKGGKVIYATSQDVETRVFQYKYSQPTILFCTPTQLSQFETIIKRYTGKADENTKANLEKRIHHQTHKMKYLQEDDSIDDLGKLKELFGGNIRIIIAGAAKTCEKNLDFIKACLGCAVIEMYGSTEVSGPVFMQQLTDTYSNNVGSALNCVQVKLQKVQIENEEDRNTMDQGENNYYGEICLKGPALFDGYYQNQEATKRCMDEQRWYHSGDLGLLLPNGALKIIGRVGSSIKLPGAIFANVEEIEQIIEQNALVDQSFIYGNGSTPYLVGVIVPKKDKVEEWFVENNIQDISYTGDLKFQKFKEYLWASIETICLQNKLIPQLIPKEIFLCAVRFEEKGLISHFGKLKREAAKKAFEDEIAAMYSSQA